MGNITFAPVKTRASIETVQQLAEKIWPEYYEPIIGSAQVKYMLGKIQSAEAIQGQINQGSLYFLIRDRNAQPFGYVAITPKPGELFLSKLYLSADYRGKGFGREAMDFVREVAKSQKLFKVTLTVHKQNPSVKAYEKIGFKIIEPVVTDIGGGFVMDDYKMEIIF